MRVTQRLEFLAFLSKVLEEFPSLFLSASLMKQLVNSLHSDRTPVQISVVHGAPGTSVQFISYLEVPRLVGEGERSGPLSHVFGMRPASALQITNAI